jgi:ubiquinone/menaquinone biosynthesis C-methylase UbiE
MTQERWQLSGSGPENYEQYQVPSIFEPLARIFLEHLPLQPGQRILDVACGTGIVARLAAPVAGTTGRIVGIDLNEGMLEVARRHSTGDSAGIEWRQGDAASLPCSDAEFDVVLCQQGLQFFPDRAGSLREMHRALVPGGLLGVCVWRTVEHSPCHLAVARALTRLIGADTARRFQAPFGFGEADALRAIIAEAGFRDVDVHAAVVTRRMRSPEESIPGLLASTPIGPEVAALDQETRTALVDEVATALSAYRDESGLKVPQATHIALARK